MTPLSDNLTRIVKKFTKTRLRLHAPDNLDNENSSQFLKMNGKFINAIKGVGVLQDFLRRVP